MTILSPTESVITWKSSTYKPESPLTIFQFIATPVNVFLSENIRALEDRVDSTSGSVKLKPLWPFTSYMFVVKDLDTDVILAEIGPKRTWPTGSLASINQTFILLVNIFIVFIPSSECDEVIWTSVVPS